LPEQAQTCSTHPSRKLSEEGLAGGLSRGFGLAAYKWNREIQERVHREYLGDPPVSITKSSPQLTAEPEITTTEIMPGDFLVVGSAGFWNSLTSQEAVGLVGLWLDRGMYQEAEREYQSDTWTTQQTVAVPTTSPSAKGIHPNDLPVSLDARDETLMYRRWDTPKLFSCVDMNAAAHLSRNALGGADEDLTRALLTIDSTWSRNLRFEICSPVP
jgi:pyruvate dehydrogenase phosphatase